MKTEKEPKWRNLKIKSEVSFGHINHDDKIHFSVAEKKEEDTKYWVRHCDAQMVFSKEEMLRLLKFLEKNLNG